MFSRTIDLLGDEGFAKLQHAFVVVMGLGGVGSHAAAALVRSGVGRLRLVDFDQLTLSSLNRHVQATQADVGEGKAAVLARHLLQVNPTLQVECAAQFFHNETAEDLLAGPPSFVVDAIDSYNPKAALLRYCVEHQLPVVSCMGASARTNPTLLRIADISQTRVCPLARVVRRKLKKFAITQGIPTVFSIELPRQPLPPDENDEVYRRGRVRNRLPSLGVMPGIFGYTAASIVITELAGISMGV